MISHRHLFYSDLAQTSPKPMALQVKSAKGIYIKDTKGQDHIDLISGIGVSCLGHRHPAVIQAINKQTKQYLHTMVYGEYIQAPQVLFANALLSTLPSFFEKVYLTNSGSEAIEGACKLAKRATGRMELVYFKNAYHGSTQGALSIAGDEKLKSAFRPLLPGTKMLSFNNLQELDAINSSTAAVVVELIQGEAGVRVAQQKFVDKLRKQCDKTGALLIIDEIQTGAGRTGKFWAFEHYGVRPDILVTGKGIGGGMPLAAFVSSSEIMNKLTHDPVLGHITTFGGHPLSCVAGLACVQVLKEKNYINEVEEKAALFRSLLKHKAIKELRSFGLLMALDLGSFLTVKKVIRKCMKKGLLSDWFLFNNKSLRIAPPLIITEREIRKSCKIILESLNELD